MSQTIVSILKVQGNHNVASSSNVVQVTLSTSVTPGNTLVVATFGFGASISRSPTALS